MREYPVLFADHIFRGSYGAWRRLIAAAVDRAALRIAVSLCVSALGIFCRCGGSHPAGISHGSNAPARVAGRGAGEILAVYGPPERVPQRTSPPRMRQRAVD